jgi:hypothetical protein
MALRTAIVAALTPVPITAGSDFLPGRTNFAWGSRRMSRGASGVGG